ncbi:Acetyltransferase [Oryctes borbonicus]|uniref:Acetyltransferase n=1 Tax=Oryctes borbonicus TaxID=1629725 RepID=A0A0T6B688_9SCAR|nr:Acetyltransferase [Oryctes borbonicus]
MEYDAVYNKRETDCKINRYQYSEHISSRRKALFPAVNDDNSDLGPMSPLSDTNSNPFDHISEKKKENEETTFKDYFSSIRNDISNYVIIDKDSADNIGETLNYKCVPRSSPQTIPLNSPSVLTKIQEETEVIESPTRNLKTPHDTSTCALKIPKLIRKQNAESMHDIETGKHNFSPTDSPCNKLQKLENSFCKISKVRTALFPDISLPTRSFYSKSEEKKMDKSPKIFNTQEKKSKLKSAPTYLCNRRSSNRNRFGQINAGVRHKIKRPKQRMHLKVTLKKAAMNAIESAHLIEFIKDMNSLSDIKPKLITVLNNDAKKLPKSSNENENLKAQNKPTECSKKFFKSDSDKMISKTLLDMSDFANDNELDLIVPSLDSIFDTLDTEEDIEINLRPNKFNPNNSGNSGTSQIILKASKTISDSDNSILFHHPHDQSKFRTCKERKRKLENKETDSSEVLLSPTSQMCDMTSGLAINSPKRAKLNITNIIDNTQDTMANNINIFNKLSSSLDIEKQKLFPIFYPSNSAHNKENIKNCTSKSNVAKKLKNLPEGQMFLDAGQKRFGFTQCPECEILYHMGDPTDERMHQNYHNSKNTLSFKGWKNENVVGILPDARIIKVSPGDSKLWWKKIKDLVEVVNRDLGYFELELNIENSVVFLYIKNRTIVGCIIAEPKPEAYKMLTSIDGIDVCSKESYPIKCGISRIWVSPAARQKGIGTALMECTRTNFSYGYVLKREEMALSSPSEFGKLFARKYFRTENFLIYTS